ncbi:MAG: type I-B CRISPR-associated protein Cas7/Cst2/DevR [Candidatus Thorarchaeota archaeon]|nr:type I-B CRISPR-associated protein Cas7/Cst2/DevR [Candidatus Thorarchaeota archaeon]
MTKVIQGFVMVDTWAAALNNAGVQSSERTDNIVRTKVIWRGRQAYPYVSGQSWRYWWRNTLAVRKGWQLSPINREAKIAYTAADPLTYPDDDIFGYMRAPKSEKDESGKKTKTTTLTRLSVLKNSPLISTGAHKPTEDFGTFSRLEGNPVPYEHEFYSTVLKGLFSIDVESAGVFKSIASAGSQNIPEDFKIPAQLASKCEKIERGVAMKKDIRIQRIRDTVEVIPHLEGGAMQARHLTRVAPSLLVIAAFKTGSHVLSHLGKEESGSARLNIEALKQVITDYRGELLTKLYVGRETGFLDEQSGEIDRLVAEYNKDIVVAGSVAGVVKMFCEEIPKLVG